jgi:hypothetical protein
LDAITQVTVIFGNRGMGKTNTGTVWAEELHKNHLRFAALDPKGVWWGIKYGRRRSEEGLPILVMGGIHGDIPIMPTAGPVVADLIVDEQVSAVIDISRHPSGKVWSQGEKIRFVADYCTRLYERQGEKRRPILQIIDEAARFVPQQIMHGQMDVARCAGAVEVLAEDGRSDGIGLLLITQRSARIAKAVTELAECMMAFHTLGPLSTQAVLDWLGSHVEKAKHNKYLDILRKLTVGHALVISPSWLKFEGIVAIRERRTYDSSFTPKAGRKAPAPGRIAKVDLAMYQQRMAETIENAQQADPKALRAKLADLHRKLEEARLQNDRVPALEDALAKANADLAAQARAKAPKEIPAIRATDVEALQDLLNTARERVETMTRNLSSAGGDMLEIVARLEKQVEGAQKALIDAQAEPLARQYTADFQKMALQTRVHGGPDNPFPGSPLAIPYTASPVGKGERTVLAALVMHPKGCTAKQLTVLTAYKRSSRDTFIGRLLQAQLAFKRDGRIYASALGVMSAGPEIEHLPTGKALRDYWLHSPKLGKGERVILSLLLSAYPEGLEKEAISNMTPYKRSSRDTFLHRLQAMELVERHDRRFAAAANLFLGG